MYQIDFHKPLSIHFIGIGGISMSGLAEILLEEGFTISGSDSKKSPLTSLLESKGAKIYYGQRASNISDSVQVVVYTAAIHPDNPEFACAKEKGIPMLTRAQLLVQIMRNTDITADCRQDTAYTDGRVTFTFEKNVRKHGCGRGFAMCSGNCDGNIRVGQSETFLTEACEYTNSFLSFFPTIGIINIFEEIKMIRINIQNDPDGWEKAQEAVGIFAASWSDNAQL